MRIHKTSFDTHLYSASSVRCAACQKNYHMGCLNPPLLRKPSKGFAWQCAFCSRKEMLEASNPSSQSNTETQDTTKSPSSSSSSSSSETKITIRVPLSSSSSPVLSTTNATTSNNHNNYNDTATVPQLSSTISSRRPTRNAARSNIQKGESPAAVPQITTNGQKQPELKLRLQMNGIDKGTQKRFRNFIFGYAHV